jgi:hypothetical protein
MLLIYQPNGLNALLSALLCAASEEKVCLIAILEGTWLSTIGA